MTDVQPYRLGQQAAPQPPALAGGLEKLGEKFARSLRAVIEPYAGVRPAVRAKPIDQTMFMMWDACVPSFVSLSLYRLHPVKGVVTLRIDAGLVGLLVDRFYGGHGPRREIERSEFTPTEARFIARLTREIMAGLVACWADITPVDASLIGRETGVSQAEIMGADEECLVQSFELDVGDKDKRLVEIVYPLAGLAGIEPAQTSAMLTDQRPADPVWRARLAARLEEVRLPARTVLARPTLKVAELVALKPGDVIPIQVARALPLIVGGRIFAHGSVGEQDGRAAFMIEKLA